MKKVQDLKPWADPGRPGTDHLPQKKIYQITTFDKASDNSQRCYQRFKSNISNTNFFKLIFLTKNLLLAYWLPRPTKLQASNTRIPT